MFHLLGEWREKAAYLPLARFLRLPSDALDAVIGDAVTTTSHRVMAAVFDGDPQPLYDIVFDEEADEFVRSRMCETLAMLVWCGELDREEVARFLRDAYTELRPQAQNYVWQGWQSAVAMLGLHGLQPLVKRIFDRRFIDPFWLRFSDFKKALSSAIKNPGEPRFASSEFTLFGDTVEELSQWAAFRGEDAARSSEYPDLLELADEPYRNPFRGVGRNDPCPCGSGKKFKNCCGA
jgi:uncharacterized protein